MRFTHFLIVFIAIFFFALFLSCGAPEKEIDKDETQIAKESDVEDKIIGETELKEFYSLLSSDSFDECMEYFTSQLRQNPGEEILKQGLIQRGNIKGKLLDYKIKYSFSEKNAEGELLFGIHTICYNEADKYHFENFRFINENGKYLIRTYEYSDVPYVSPEIANDSESDLKSFLNNMYQAINTDKFENVKVLMDNEIIEHLGEETLENGYLTKIAIKSEIVDFTVESAIARIEREVPVVEMIIKEDTKDGTFKSEVLLSARADGYKLVMIDDIPVTEFNDKSNLSKDEEKLIQDYVNGFYKALESAQYKAIVGYVDDDVFLNNSKDAILNSFEQRNSLYGFPEKETINSVIRNKVGDRDSFEIVATVYNDSGKNSNEKLVLVKTIKGQYKIYAYEYSETNN
ncbi:MAG: hypothetical protein C0596_13235 [Marinilabiliales bacterium]|nr:MAG: hypothetical protein C0596_13235 [Marinilabiliales bacterium]